MSSLDLPHAVAGPAGTADESIAWHFGDPHREQRLLAEGIGIVDISNRGVVTVTGPDRLTWLHTLTTQHLENLQPHESALALILSPHGHVEQVIVICVHEFFHMLSSLQSFLNYTEDNVS